VKIDINFKENGLKKVEDEEKYLISIFLNEVV